MRKATVQERQAIADAMARWCQSQEMNSKLAAFVMTSLAGTIAGLHAEDRDHLDHLLTQLGKELHHKACHSYDRKREFGDE